MDKKDLSILENSIVDGIRNRKGKKIAILELSSLESAPCSKFIICEGTSATHTGAIADSIRDYVLEHTRFKPYNYDGYRNSQWIVLDYGDIMVHVFIPEFRQFYDLEQLWNDAPTKFLEDID